MAHAIMLSSCELHYELPCQRHKRHKRSKKIIVRLQEGMGSSIGQEEGKDEGV